VPQGRREGKVGPHHTCSAIAICYIRPMRRIVYQTKALRALRALPMGTAARIRGKIEQYAEAPASLAPNVRKLQGRDGYRLRIGDYRVIFDEDGAVLDILDIGHRSRIYD
jgi:mRNA interferase RelE/StbE